MRIHRLSKPADVLLPPTGDLSSSVSPALIKGRGEQLALNGKIKTTKLSSGGEMGFSQKFGPAKISCYTVSRLTLANHPKQASLSEEKAGFSARLAHTCTHTANRMQQLFILLMWNQIKRN